MIYGAWKYIVNKSEILTNNRYVLGTNFVMWLIRITDTEIQLSKNVSVVQSSLYMKMQQRMRLLVVKCVFLSKPAVWRFQVLSKLCANAPEQIHQACNNHDYFYCGAK